MCCLTEIEGADQVCYLCQWQYTDTSPTSSSTDPLPLDIWRVATRVPIFYPDDLHMELCNQSCLSILTARWKAGWLASRPAVLIAKTLMLDIMCNFFNQICSYLLCWKALLISNTLYRFQWPWLWLWVTRPAQSKACWLNFPTHFSTD